MAGTGMNQNVSYCARSVLATCDRFKMLWSDARRIMTKVIQFHPPRNRADKQFIGETVGGSGPLPAITSACVDSPIASVSLCRSPQPAGVGLVHLRPEAFFEGECGQFLKPPIFPHSHCVVSAQTTRPWWVRLVAILNDAFHAVIIPRAWERNSC